MTRGGDPKSCNCTPSYYGVVWDRAARKQRKTRRFRGVMEARNARKDLADALSEGTALAVAGPRLDAARERLHRRGARRRRAQQVGPALPAPRVEGPGVVAAARARRARAPPARRRHARRRAAPRRRHDAGRRLGLARAQRRQRAALAVPLGAGPRPGRARPGGERAAARRWTPSRAIGSQRPRSSRSCSPRSKPDGRAAVGAGRLRARRASRRSACSTGVTST